MLNARPDHLLRIKNGEEPTSLDENLLDAQLFVVKNSYEYYEEIIKFFPTITPQ